MTNCRVSKFSQFAVLARKYEKCSVASKLFEDRKLILYSCVFFCTNVMLNLVSCGSRDVGCGSTVKPRCKNDVCNVLYVSMLRSYAVKI